jgi:hypothetical protein
VVCVTFGMLENVKTTLTSAAGAEAASRAVAVMHVFVETRFVSALGVSPRLAAVAPRAGDALQAAANAAATTTGASARALMRPTYGSNDGNHTVRRSRANF